MEQLTGELNEHDLNDLMRVDSDAFSVISRDMINIAWGQEELVADKMYFSVDGELINPKEVGEALHDLNKAVDDEIDAMFDEDDVPLFDDVPPERLNDYECPVCGNFNWHGKCKDCGFDY